MDSIRGELFEKILATEYPNPEDKIYLIAEFLAQFFYYNVKERSATEFEMYECKIFACAWVVNKLKNTKGEKLAEEVRFFFSEKLDFAATKAIQKQLFLNFEYDFFIHERFNFYLEEIPRLYNEDINYLSIINKMYISPLSSINDLIPDVSPIRFAELSSFFSISLKYFDQLASEYLEL